MIVHQASCAVKVFALLLLCCAMHAGLHIPAPVFLILGIGCLALASKCFQLVYIKKLLLAAALRGSQQDKSRTQDDLAALGTGTGPGLPLLTAACQGAASQA